jgi:hypothetical protein
MVGMKGLRSFCSAGFKSGISNYAGTTDEAGNNVVNLLAKINSQDAANAAARIKFNGKGIDLPGTLVRARGKGMNALRLLVVLLIKLLVIIQNIKA